jgi:hypothetical protein
MCTIKSVYYCYRSASLTVQSYCNNLHKSAQHSYYSYFLRSPFTTNVMFIIMIIIHMHGQLHTYCSISLMMFVYFSSRWQWQHHISTEEDGKRPFVIWKWISRAGDHHGPINLIDIRTNAHEHLVMGGTPPFQAGWQCCQCNARGGAEICYAISAARLALRWIVLRDRTSVVQTSKLFAMAVCTEAVRVWLLCVCTALMSVCSANPARLRGNWSCTLCSSPSQTKIFMDLWKDPNVQRLMTSIGQSLRLPWQSTVM